MTKPTYVVDASTCLKWIFEDEVYSNQALSLQKDFLSGKIILIAPSLWSYEITNGIKSAISRNRLTANQGQSLLNLLIKSKPDTFSLDDLLPECLENATSFQISVYDSAYVTLSRINNIPFIISDEKLVNKITTLPFPILLKDYQAVI